MVNLFKEDLDSLPEINLDLENWLAQVCATEERELQELNIIFCSDNQILKMNQEHLQHDYYTDIITFEHNVGDLVFGDLFISVDRVEDNANELGLTPQDELHRVIVHGVLHLCGHADTTDQERAAMREREDFYLSLRAL